MISVLILVLVVATAILEPIFDDVNHITTILCPASVLTAKYITGRPDCVD